LPAFYLSSTISGICSVGFPLNLHLLSKIFIHFILAAARLRDQDRLMHCRQRHLRLPNPAMHLFPPSRLVTPLMLLPRLSAP
jgi:hypothetical protein